MVKRSPVSPLRGKNKQMKGDVEMNRDYDFGNYLTELRKKKGYSQFQLGKLVGVSDKAVSKWETGVSRPKMQVIRKLAAFLDADVYKLLGLKQDEPDEDTPLKVPETEEDVIKSIMADIEAYKQAISDAEGALEAAEMELDECLDDYARKHGLLDDSDCPEEMMEP